VKIRQVAIKNLFGYMDPKIALNTSESITIIHGPNGCGKTTILELVRAVFDTDMAYLRRVPYESIEICFDDGTKLQVRRTEDKSTLQTEKPRRQPKIQIGYSATYADQTQQEYTHGPSIARERQIPLSMIEKEIPELLRIGPREWLNRRTDQVMTLEDVAEAYDEQIIWPRKERQLPEWLEKLVQSIRVYLIRSQRLLLPTRYSYGREEAPSEVIIETIELFARELAKIISERLAESVNISQSLDRSFPSRLLSAGNADTIDEGTLRRKYAEVEERREQLMAVGLIEEEGRVWLPGQSMDATERKVLSLYIEDTEKKLHAFDELQRKLAAFSDIINSKMSSTKSIVIDRRKGFLFKTIGGSGQDLSPKQLSSGEQHQVVLFYDLIFRAKPESLILIDEPEISLHVSWQRQFLKDLLRVNTLNKQEFLIATHSPQIIHDRWDLAVPLDGGLSRE
jgi:predicted ATP-binding protein involved in virulence